jgi:hypothetical protein
LLALLTKDSLALSLTEDEIKSLMQLGPGKNKQPIIKQLWQASDRELPSRHDDQTLTLPLAVVFRKRSCSDQSGNRMRRRLRKDRRRYRAGVLFHCSHSVHCTDATSAASCDSGMVGLCSAAGFTRGFNLCMCRPNWKQQLAGPRKIATRNTKRPNGRYQLKRRRQWQRQWKRQQHAGQR